MPIPEQSLTPESVAELNNSANAAAKRMIKALDNNDDYVSGVVDGLKAGDVRTKEVLGDQPVLSLRDALKAYSAKKITQEQFYAHLIQGANREVAKRRHR
jgi:hypothetical protein